MKGQVVTDSNANHFSGFEDHYTPLAKFAYLVTGNMDIAQELAHEVLLRASEALLDFRASHARAYLRTTVMNLWRRRLRRRGMEAMALVRIGSPSLSNDWPDSVDDRDVIWRALRKLPYGSRVCVVLRYYEDLSLSEIARETRLPVGTVKSRISRALKRLATYLESEHE